MRCPWPSVVAAALTALVSAVAASWWSWKQLETRLAAQEERLAKDFEKRLAAHEDRLTRLEQRYETGHSKRPSVTAEEPRSEMPKSPKTLPRRLQHHAADQPKKTIEENFDSFASYLRGQEAPAMLSAMPWVTCLLAVNTYGEFPSADKDMNCNDISDLTDAEKATITYSAIGFKAKLFAVLEKHHGDVRLHDLAVASAAFGIAVLPHFPPGVKSAMGLGNLLRPIEIAASSNLDDRLEIARHLLTQYSTGNLTFVGFGLEMVRKKVITVEPEMLRVVAWGTLRWWLIKPSADSDCDYANSAYYVQSGGLQSALRNMEGFADLSKSLTNETTFKETYPAFAIQYAVEHPEVLDEKTSDGLTMMMEASKLRSCKVNDLAFTGLLEAHEMLDMPINTMAEWGKDAAMLAEEAGYANRSAILEEKVLEKDLEDTPFVYHFPYMALLILGSHIVLFLVSMIFIFGHGSGSVTRATLATHGQDFVMKIVVFMACNALIMSSTAPALLLRPGSLLKVSCNLHVPSSWPIFFLLGVAFLVFVILDFRKANDLAQGQGPVAKTVTAENIYQDPKVPILTCLHTFVLSCVFVCVYWSALVQPIEMNLFSKFLWSCSLFVQYYISSKFKEESRILSFASLSRWAVRLDDQENNELWAVLLRQSKMADGAVNGQIPRLSRVEVLLRFAMCYVSNGLFRILIVYSLPVYLAASGSASDFALNAFAVTFISELDDLPDSVDYELGEYEPLQGEQCEMKPLA
ncbi:unnamed protein product [Symbiodinium necroappetens]|uniref:Uncharacterized protein n=1 Tax=Symbiodinium necroappetens TaxID=1628268 RepID=A0A812XKJ8_9DINO|nr:unnamed protein product [Symbiodinium necroappetens]